MLEPDARIIEIAGDVVGYTLDRLAADQFANKRSGSIIVMDFTHGFRPLPEGMTIKGIVTDDDLFDDYYGDLIVFKENFNEDGLCKVEYLWNCRAKALLAGREDLTTNDVVKSAPFRLQKRDGRYQGGVCLHGVSCGFSGVEPEWDEVLATLFVSILFGYAQLQANLPSKNAFFE